MKIYDSLCAKKIDFKPGKTIKMYVCGPTVYDHAHLGHGRSALVFDLIRRYFEFLGHKVEFVSNYTDIDDKMIMRAAEQKKTVVKLAEEIIPEYQKDYSLLGIKPPTKTPKATEFIKEMVELIKQLEQKGYTYQISDGLYYDVSKFPEYGKLSHQKLEELNAGARVDENKEKRNHQDFVLWKLKKEGEPSWPSPWGEGRPGWHIECSAMSQTLLGDTFDIHGGGLDLKFPHHECEIAQSEAASGLPLAKIWMHNGFITVNEEKMSKSLGNFFLLKDIFKKYHPRVVRFFLLSTHYRSPIEFSEELLEKSRESLRKLDFQYLYYKNVKESTNSTKHEIKGFLEKELDCIKMELNDDFNIAGVLGLIYTVTARLSTDAGNSLPSKHNIIEINNFFSEVNKILNIFPEDFRISAKQKILIKERESARADRDWKKSDAIRDQLAVQGIEIEDTKDGPFARPKI